jgi:nucleoside-diphosphate-sugar epimerase
MKALVTGGAGFIGSHLVDRLLGDGWDIVVLDDLLTGKLSNLSHQKGNKKLQIVKGDIRSLRTLKRVSRGCDAIFHMAAHALMRVSLTDHKADLEYNLIGTTNVLEAMISNKVHDLIFASCYDSETRALTKEGLKTWDQLMEGDLILTINPKTKELQYKPIKKLYVQPYTGVMIHFKGKRTDLLVTPNHRMIMKTFWSDMIEFRQAIDLTRLKTGFVIPSPIWNGPENRTFILSKFVDQSKLSWNSIRVRDQYETIDMLYLIGLYIGDGYIRKDVTTTESKTGYKRPEYLARSHSKENGRFTKIKEKGPETQVSAHQSRISLCIPESDKSRNKVLQYLQKMGFVPRLWKNEIVFSSKALADFLSSECGNGAHNKRIPRWAMEYAKAELVYLYEGLMDSDGYRGIDKNGYSRTPTFTTVSEYLARDMIELALKLGMHPTISTRHNFEAVLHGRKVHSEEVYYISMGQPEQGIHKWEREDYSGIIWCASVENENFLVERNGKYSFSGNSSAIYGEAAIVPTPEEYIGIQTSLYGAAKLACEAYLQAYSEFAPIKSWSFRFGTVLGERCRRGAIWDFEHKLRKNPRELEILGNGKQRKDYLYVKDCVDGIILGYEKSSNKVNIFNLGLQEQTSVDELADIVIQEMGLSNVKKKYTGGVRGWIGDNPVVYLSIKKIQELGWKPKMSPVDAIRLTAKWTLNEVRGNKRLLG